MPDSTHALARAAAQLYDGMIRSILDKALGPTSWSIADVPRCGVIRRHPNGDEELHWNNRLLATIHRTVTTSADYATCRITYEVRYH